MKTGSRAVSCAIFLLLFTTVIITVSGQQDEIQSSFTPITSRLKNSALAVHADEETPESFPKLGTQLKVEGRTINKEALENSLKYLMSLFPSRENALKKVTEKVSDDEKQDPSNDATTQGTNGFSLADLLPNGLRALEGLDDMLRSTVPRVDRFKCLERVMCEFASPFQEEPDRGTRHDDDGIHTLQQLHNSQRLPHHLQTQAHLRPHEQQFLQHQQHQNHAIRQSLQQQQPQNVPPPLPYYIPTVAQNPVNNVPRGAYEDDENYLAHNSVRRVEPFKVSEINYHPQRKRNERQHINHLQQSGNQVAHTQHYQQQHPQYPSHVSHQNVAQNNPSNSQYHIQNSPTNQQQHHYGQLTVPPQQAQNTHIDKQQSAYSPYQYQVASSYTPQESEQPSNVYKRYVTPEDHYNPNQRQIVRQQQQKRRRRPASFSKFVSNIFNLGGNSQRRNNNRRYKRDTPLSDVESMPVLKRSSRRNKVAPAFQEDTLGFKETPELVKTSRTAKMSPSFRSIDAIPKEENLDSPIKTLTKEDLELIKRRIESINKDVGKNSTSGAFTGRSARQGRFLNTILGGWNSNGIMKLLDQLMEGYSFHPYTHAAYMGITSRDGTCQRLYPRCPDDANDMLDFVNNFHQYFPNGLPFADNLPWPLNLLTP